MSYASAVPLALQARTDARERPEIRPALLRIFLLSLLFGLELLAISIALDGEALTHRTGLEAVMGNWGAWTLRSILGFVALFLTFVFLAYGPVLDQLSARIARRPIRWELLALHAGALAAFARFSAMIYSNQSALGRYADLAAAAWFAAGIAAIVSGALAFVPWAAWSELMRASNPLWAWALAGSLAACLVGNLSRMLWNSASLATLALSKALLLPFLPGVLTDPPTRRIGTLQFHVRITPECSGLEGAALILAFTAIWLILFRRECRFPQALALIPAGILLSFFLNSVRIAALVWIGNHGAPQIAMGGFHSQAGWILFNLIGMAFCLTVRNSRWFTRMPPRAQDQADAQAHAHAPNPSAAYLSPFLAILASGMLAAAASGRFEWLYSVRLFAAAGALWFYRREYSGLDWRASRIAPICGVGIFLLWIAVQRLANPHAAGGMPAPLAAASPFARVTWISLYILAAAITVPIAEELAFRGFLMRRLVSVHFATLPFQRVTAWAVIVSSAVFGALHGSRWLAASLTGVLLALLLIRRGRIGDAIVAHATANGLLAAYVLLAGNWQIW